MERRFTRSIAALTLAVVFAISSPATASAQQIPDDMPAPELLELAPPKTRGIIAVDMTRAPRDQLPEATSSTSPVQPQDVKKIAVFVESDPEMLVSVLGQGPAKVPFSVILTHSGDPGAVDNFLSDKGSSAGSELGQNVYRVRRKDQEYFATSADEETLIAAESRERLSQMVQSYQDGEGPGLPDDMASTLRPGKNAALVAAFMIPQEVSAMIQQNKSAPKPASGLKGVCVSLGFPGEKLAARVVGLFQEVSQAQQASQMLSKQLAMLKQGGAGKMMPGEQDGGEMLSSILDTVNVSTSGPELTVSAQARLSDIRGAVGNRP